jgi:hypothetical protein
MKDPVKDKRKRFGLYLPFGELAFFPTVAAAVTKCRRAWWALEGLAARSNTITLFGARPHTNKHLQLFLNSFPLLWLFPG